MCDDVFDIEILTDGSLNFTHPCVTPNGSVLDIEQDFVIHSIVDYAQQYGQHYNYVYGYLNGSAHVTVPSGAVFSTSGQFNTSGQVVESGGIEPCPLAGRSTLIRQVGFALTMAQCTQYTNGHHSIERTSA